MSIFPDARDIAAEGGIFTAFGGDQYNISVFNLDKHFSGIVHTSDDQKLSYLPLDSVHVDACVIDGAVPLVK
jgi:hypothetical protein